MICFWGFLFVKSKELRRMEDYKESASEPCLAKNLLALLFFFSDLQMSSSEVMVNS